MQPACHFFILKYFFRFVAIFYLFFSLAFLGCIHFPAKIFPFSSRFATGSIRRGFRGENDAAMTTNLCCTFLHNFSARFRAFNFRIVLNVYAHLKFNLVFSSLRTPSGSENTKMFHACFAFHSSILLEMREKKSTETQKSQMRRALRKSKFNYFPESTRKGRACRVHLITAATLASLIVLGLCVALLPPKIQYVHFILHFNCCWQFSQSLKLCYFTCI